MNVGQEIVVAIIEEKVHKDTLEKWKEIIKKREFPNLEDLTDFLYRTRARISKRKNDSNSKHSADKDSSPFKKRKFEFKRQSLMIVASDKCILCSEAHHLL